MHGHFLSNCLHVCLNNNCARPYQKLEREITIPISFSLVEGTKQFMAQSGALTLE